MYDSTLLIANLSYKYAKYDTKYGGAGNHR